MHRDGDVGKKLTASLPDGVPEDTRILGDEGLPQV
jgi:hypothetical protein